ncbi:MAG: MG2 domain-containing protein [Saprospiraceae bacterium]
MRNIFFCITFLLVGLPIVKGQNTVADNYRIKLEAFRAMHPPAMIYFHFDKPAYSPGDTIHYKVYQVETEDWKPRPTPQFIDIEIIRLSDAETIQKERTIVDNGVGMGAFQLSKEMMPGIYRLKADSHLMNFNAKDIDFQYDFKIIGNLPDSGHSDIHAECYIEGGNWVAGVLSHVVVTANSDLMGKLVNEKGDSLAAVQITNGFASFKFRPKTIEKLFVELNNKRFPLPEVKKHGTVITIDNQPNDANIAIILSSKLAPGLSEKRLTLMCDHDGKTGLYFDIVAQNGKVIQLFPKSAFRHGINRILLIDSAMNILNERLIYHHSPRLMYLKVNKSTTAKGDDDEIILELSAENKEGLPVEADLSISVVDSVVQTNALDYDNIVQTFSLQQNLLNRIPKVEKMFESNKLIDTRLMDLHMISSKYGRFQWSDVKNYEYQPLEPFRLPYADERKAIKEKGFAASNGLIYWNPSVLLKNGMAKAIFKAPKGAKLHYKITGFDKKGLIGNLEF